MSYVNKAIDINKKSLKLMLVCKVPMAESAWDIPYLNGKITLFHYQIFKSYFFVVITFPILLSDFNIELLSKDLITKYENFMTKKI